MFDLLFYCYPNLKIIKILLFKKMMSNLVQIFFNLSNKMRICMQLF
jgi:hypothetical protein